MTALNRTIADYALRLRRPYPDELARLYIVHAQLAILRTLRPGCYFTLYQLAEAVHVHHPHPGFVPPGCTLATVQEAVKCLKAEGLIEDDETESGYALYTLRATDTAASVAHLEERVKAHRAVLDQLVTTPPVPDPSAEQRLAWSMLAFINRLLGAPGEWVSVPRENLQAADELGNAGHISADGQGRFAVHDTVKARAHRDYLSLHYGTSGESGK